MNTDKRVAEALAAAFTDRQAVFWHDVDREFSAAVETLAQDTQARLVQLDQQPALQVKLDIERAPAQRWLLYSTQPEPEPAQDWLLDVRLRSRAFRADSSSMLLEDLGLTSLALLPHLKARARFLRARERVERLKRLVLPDDDEAALDRKMMAVLLRSDEADALALALRLLHGLWVPDETRIADEAKGWSDIVAHGLDAAFWEQMGLHLGYEAAQPSLPDLLRRVLVTDLARGLDAPCPAALEHLLLPQRALAANASVLAARWRSDMNLHRAYAELSAAVAESLGLKDLLAPLQPEALADCVTFAEVERCIIGALKERVTRQGGAVLDGLRALVARRRDGPWVHRLAAQGSAEAMALAACYDALEAAAEFLALKEHHAEGFSFADAADAVARYRTTLFRFDQLYRRFHHAVGRVEPMGWSVLHGLRGVVEGAYAGWFMPQLASAWGTVVEGPQGLPGRWRIDELPPQQRFFDARVAGAFKGSVKRVFVLISDALRYEAAEQLAQEINARNRLTAQLDAMLGVLPSYTALGMAALLPHRTLAYRGNNVEVFADGLPTGTLEARNAVLARYDGMAIKADELLALGKEKGRERVRDRRVVYVYHDRIDMLGDKQGTEDQTFNAVHDTIAELQAIVSFIVNSLNGSTVLVTADHGFIYQESELDQADKAALTEKPTGTLKAKKRYLLGRNLEDSNRVWRGNTAATAGTEPGEGSLDFWVPKGTARFHFVGGAQFVHGSAMPQEVIVPVVTVRESEAATARTRQVTLSLLGASNKVVTNTQRFEFIQSEPVSAQVRPRTVLVSLRDGQPLISDEAALTLDSASASLDERVRSLFLTVRSGHYDRLRDYHLVVRDAETQVELLRVPVRIDLAFSNDF